MGRGDRGHHGAKAVTAIGGSLIKPCIVGTVANTTNADTKTLGFSIYYSLVNFGGAIGPVLALLIRQDLGIEFVLIMRKRTLIGDSCPSISGLKWK